METHEITELRPRFKYLVTFSQEEILSRVRKVVELDEQIRIRSAMKHHIVLEMKAKFRHYWSPQVDIGVEPVEGGMIVRGIIGPKPSVWTMFMFFYGLFGFMSLIGIISGVSQLHAENFPIGFIIAPLAGLTIIGIHFLGQHGKNLGRTESILLQELILKGLDYPPTIKDQ